MEKLKVKSTIGRRVVFYGPQGLTVELDRYSPNDWRGPLNGICITESIFGLEKAYQKFNKKGGIMKYQYSESGDKIRRFREMLGLNKSQFAKIFDVSGMCVAKWEMGVSDYPGRFLRIVRNNFSVNIDFFLVKCNQTMYKGNGLSKDITYCRRILK